MNIKQLNRRYIRETSQYYLLLLDKKEVSFENTLSFQLWNFQRLNKILGKILRRWLICTIPKKGKG